MPQQRQRSDIHTTFGALGTETKSSGCLRGPGGYHCAAASRRKAPLRLLPAKHKDGDATSLQVPILRACTLGRPGLQGGSWRREGHTPGTPTPLLGSLLPTSSRDAPRAGVPARGSRLGSAHSRRGGVTCIRKNAGGKSSNKQAFSVGSGHLGPPLNSFMGNHPSPAGRMSEALPWALERIHQTQRGGRWDSCVAGTSGVAHAPVAHCRAPPGLG